MLLNYQKTQVMNTKKNLQKSKYLLKLFKEMVLVLMMVANQLILLQQLKKLLKDK